MPRLNTPMLKTNIRSLVCTHINLQDFGSSDPGLKTDCQRPLLETDNCVDWVPNLSFGLAVSSASTFTHVVLLEHRADSQV